MDHTHSHATGLDLRPSLPPSPDLADRQVYALVRRLYFRRFSTRVAALGIDVEDGLQEVLMRLWTRSLAPRSRWDPRRGGLSTWIFVAVQGITINIAAHAQRRITLVPSSPADDGDPSVLDGLESSADWTARDLSDLAATLDLPVSVLLAHGRNEDVFAAACCAGLDFLDASDAASRLDLMA